MFWFSRQWLYSSTGLAIRTQFGMCPIVFATVIFPNRTKPDRGRGFSSMTRILIVDDNPHVRNALRVCLQMNQGHEVCGEAENGQDGMELARQLKPDIVLLDYA